MSCTEKNILEREGSSHLNRVLAALSPGYAKPDERNTADILLFAKRYAAYLNYYKEDDTEDGSWKALMMMDISVILATLVKTDTRVVADYKKLLYKKIQIADTEAKAKLAFRFLFDLIFSLVKTIDDQYKLVPADLEFKILFKSVVEVKMQEAFLKIHSLFNEFKTTGWIDVASPDLDSDAPIPVTNARNFDLNELSAEWRTLTPETIITLPAFADVKDNIIHIINHNLFNAQIETIWKGITEIVTHASKLFEQTLTEFPSHTPHYALFLSFVKIFQHAQGHLNGYTQRHLDFYYKDVLQLKNKPAEADMAHVIFELQKPVSKHLLKKDVLLKGGKDSTGKEITYALTDDIVLNKASVAVIQSHQVMPNTGRLIASPVAASDDGQGAELKSIDKSWSTFGDTDKATSAKTGFAIASNLLFLKEGTRTIFITVRFQNKIPKLVANARTSVKCFSARLTGEKAWHEIAQADLYIQASDTFLFKLRLSSDDPAIIPYAEATHKENFREGLPVVQLFLQKDSPGALPYTQLHKKKNNSIIIYVIVNCAK